MMDIADDQLGKSDNSLVSPQPIPQSQQTRSQQAVQPPMTTYSSSPPNILSRTATPNIYPTNPNNNNTNNTNASSNIPQDSVTGLLGFNSILPKSNRSQSQQQHPSAVPNRFYGHLPMDHKPPSLFGHHTNSTGSVNNPITHQSKTQSLNKNKSTSPGSTSQLLSMNTNHFLSSPNFSALGASNDDNSKESNQHQNQNQNQNQTQQSSAALKPQRSESVPTHQSSLHLHQAMHPQSQNIMPSHSETAPLHLQQAHPQQQQQQQQLPPRKPKFSSAAADLEYAVLTNIIREKPEPVLNNDGSLSFLDSVSMSESNSMQSGSQNYMMANFPFFETTGSNPSIAGNNASNNNNNHQLRGTNAATAASTYSDTPTPPNMGSPSGSFSLFAPKENTHSHYIQQPHHQIHHNHHHQSHHYSNHYNGLTSYGNHHNSSLTAKQHPNHQHNLHNTSHLNQLHGQPSPQIQHQSQPAHSFDSYNLYPQWDPLINQYFLGPLPGLPDSKPYLTYPDIIEIIDANTKKNDQKQQYQKSHPAKHTRSTLSFSIGVHSDDNSHNFSHNHELSAEWGLQFKEPEEIYSQVKSPFSYTTGFHLLVNYLRRRFDDDKTVLVKLAKSMAEYRPSFTAQVMSLKEEDLIFMEQCFQRTLLEYNKYLSISGTPTIIWRRTGQIAYVSQEFVMLTGWTSEMLLSKATFIVELMDDLSVIRYFELFSKIAYGDTKGASTSDCNLVNPKRDKLIRTKSIWTLKRDVFGIPMMIIGNFLPILD